MRRAMQNTQYRSCTRTIGAALLVVETSTSTPAVARKVCARQTLLWQPCAATSFALSGHSSTAASQSSCGSSTSKTGEVAAQNCDCHRSSRLPVVHLQAPTRTCDCTRDHGYSTDRTTVSTARSTAGIATTMSAY